jgi:hypothetical protein
MISGGENELVMLRCHEKKKWRVAIMANTAS